MAGQLQAGRRMLISASAMTFMVFQLMAVVAAEQCGTQASGALCPGGLCCSQFGWCGSTPPFCGSGCQSQCDGGSPPTSTSTTGSTGLASFYTEYLPSACYGYDGTQLPGNMHFAAGGDSPNANIWNNGRNCGKIFRIQCQGKGCRGSGAITVKIVDRCPNGCVGGRAFDLSAQAFAAIADPDVGVITVTYSLASEQYGDGGEDAAALPWAQEERIAEVGGHGSRKLK